VLHRDDGEAARCPARSSEGATAVARYNEREFAARIVFAWSCEDNDFVEVHGTRVIAEQPILNVIGAVDPFFPPANPWLGNPVGPLGGRILGW
jgi:hypothetical protein